MVSIIDKENISPIKKTPKKRVLKKPGVSKERIVVVKKSPASDDHFVSVSKSVGLASVIMTALVVTITPTNTWILGPVIGAMCIFGIAMGYFASK